MSNKELATIEKKVNPLVAEAESIEIKNAKDMEKAVELLSTMNKIGDRIEEEKQKTLKPANEVVKAIRAQWKPIESMYDTGISLLRSKMSKYQTQAKAIADEEAARIAARVGKGKGKLQAETAMAKIDELEKPESLVTTEAGAVKFRTDRVLKITDTTLIPRMFLIPDEKLILTALKAGEKVPGCEIEEIQVPVNYR